MAFIKIDKAAQQALDALTKEIDAKTREAVDFAEKNKLKLDLISGTYIPDSLEGEGISEDDIPEGCYNDYDYVNAEHSGWVGSAYHC